MFGGKIRYTSEVEFVSVGAAVADSEVKCSACACENSVCSGSSVEPTVVDGCDIVIRRDGKLP